MEFLVQPVGSIRRQHPADRKLYGSHAPGFPVNRGQKIVQSTVDAVSDEPEQELLCFWRQILQIALHGSVAG